MNSENEAKLTVKIENVKPVELLDLSDSLQCLGRQYVRYLTKHNVKISNEARLYVKEIRAGSVIIDLQDLLPFSVLFADAKNFNNVVDFAKNLKQVYDFFLGKVASPKEELKEQDLKNYNAIVNPVAKDAGAQMFFNATFNNFAVVVYQLSSLEANAAQNSIRRELDNIKETVAGFHDKVVFYWHTIRNAQDVSTGEKGVIESINSMPVKVTFLNDALKNEIAFMKDYNPMLSGFVVDVQVETIQDRPVLYKILKVHDVV